MEGWSGREGGRERVQGAPGVSEILVWNRDDDMEGKGEEEED